ncbi:molybdopterin dinucleotide-binding protein [Parvibacter caecicola]|nr:molybdopterin dinucleotide-binding protein [Parvibacter caecicola]
MIRVFSESRRTAICQKAKTALALGAKPRGGEMTRLNLARRSFLKLSAATGAAMAVAGGTASAAFGEAPAGASPKGETKVIRSFCRACGKMECPNWVTVQNGRVVSISGDESACTSRGNLCVKGRTAMQQLYHPDRVKYPMRRTNPKGEDPGWVRISWDEAISSIAKGVQECRDKYGNHTVKILHGTSRITTYGIEGLSQGLQTSNIGNTAGQICKGPREFSGAITAYMGVHWINLSDHPKVFFQWGSDQEVSNYDNACRVTVDAYNFAERSICVGPRTQNLGKETDLQLHLRPGTDDFLALGMINLLVNEKKTYDQLFVKKWTNAPFLYVADKAPAEFTWEYCPYETGVGFYPLNLRTQLLTEADLVEGGSPKRFMVWDSTTGKPIYFDSETALWEGETEYLAPTEFQPAGLDNTGTLVIDPGLPLQIDPALEGEFTVTLKDGTAVTAVPVWQKYCDHLSQYDPATVAATCDIPEDQLRQAVDIYCAEPNLGGISYNLPTEHAANSIQTTRSILALSALMGNVDNVGGNCGGHGQDGNYHNYFMYCVPFGQPSLPLNELEKIAGVEKFPLLPWATKCQGAANFHDTTSATDMILTGNPYPIRCMISDTGSHFHAANATKNWEAYKTLDFYWGSELWFSPTIELADIITPAAHFLEIGCVRSSQGAEKGYGIMVPCVEPLAEAEWDATTCVRVAEALNLGWWPTKKEFAPPFWPEEWLDSEYPTAQQMHELEVLPVVMGMNLPGHNGSRLEFSSWDDAVQQYQEHGQWNLREVSPIGYYRRYINGYIRTDGLPGFGTPTTKFELFSTVLETYHPGEEWPIAREPQYSPYSTPDLYQEYPIIFTSGRRNPLFFHSEGRQVPMLREQSPVPCFQINPETAKELGIEQGDWCWIESPKGKIREVADLFYGIKPGTIEADHGWWYPELPAPTHGFDLSNANVMVDEYVQDPIIGSTNLRAYLVKVYKATPENSPYGDPVPRATEDGTPIISTPDDERLKRWLPNYEEA